MPRGSSACLIARNSASSSSDELRGRAGSGLGLAIVRAIARAHRGKVDVRSEPEHGARFRILLPRLREAA